MRKPDDARARPAKHYETEEALAAVFDPNADRRHFLTCISIDRFVRSYLVKRADVPKDERTDIRFYMDAWLAAHAAGKFEPSEADLAALSGSLKKLITQAHLESACDKVRQIYQAAGGNDRAAKGSAMPTELQKSIEASLDEKEAT